MLFRSPTGNTAHARCLPSRTDVATPHDVPARLPANEEATSNAAPKRQNHRHAKVMTIKREGRAKHPDGRLDCRCPREVLQAGSQTKLYRKTNQNAIRKMRKNGGKITPRGKNVKHTYLAAKKTLKEVYVSVSLNLFYRSIEVKRR